MGTPLAAALLSLVPMAPAQDSGGAFDALFTGRALRYDYHHVGTAGEEHLARSRVRLEGEWPGSRTRLVDDTNLGKYLVRVVDLGTHRTIYSRGFASIYGEWETTADARERWASIHESVRFPEPRERVQLTISKRDDHGAFREIHSDVIDPSSRFVDRSPLTRRGAVTEFRVGGPVATQVDLLILADGYTAAQAGDFQEDCRRLLGAFFACEPFAGRAADFSVRGIHVPAAQSGISKPRSGVWCDAPLGCSFNAFDSERYVLTFANEALREVAAQVPYDAIIILFKDRKYGGGGIFNLWSTCAADSAESEYLFLHEFGHSFAGLADEYYSSQVSYEEFTKPGVEPWEPNITALLDPEALKWRDLVEAATPLPTPWNQADYDAEDREYQAERAGLRESGAGEAEMEALFDRTREASTRRLTSEPWAGKVGAFEGAGYQAKGLFRSEIDCIMFTRNANRFSRVSRRAIERVIDLYAQ